MGARTSMRMSIRWKTVWRIAIGFFLLALCTTGIFPGDGGAEEEKPEKPFVITYDLPLGGIVKSGDWTQLELRLQNRGEAFAGEVAIERLYPDQPQKSPIRKKVKLGQGEETQLSFIVPGEYVVDGAVKIFDDQRVVQEEPIRNIERIEDGAVVGILSDRPESYHFLTLVPGEGAGRMAIRPLPAAEIPEDPLLLQTVDLLIVDKLERQRLNGRQAQAVERWVKAGGVMIVSGGEPYRFSRAMFPALLPLPYEGLERRTDLRELAAMAGEEALPFSSLETLKGVSGWVAAYEAGRGKVILPAFDPASEELSSWKGNVKLWQRIFADYRLSPSLHAGKESDPYGRLVETRQQIPGVHPPSLKMITSVWAAYILLAGPVLYWFLKRRDRREWAWFIIPSLSLLLTVFVYTYGKQQIAGDNVIHTVSNVEILDPSLAHVESSASFFMVDGDAITLQTAEGAKAGPTQVSYREAGTVYYDRNERGQTLLHYENVPYLTLKQAYAEHFLTSAGQFVSRLHIRGDRLVGTLTNQTAYDFQQVIVTVGVQRFEFGPLKKGGTLSVDARMKKVLVPVERMEQPRPHEDGGPAVPAEIARERLAVPSEAGDFLADTGGLPAIEVLGVSEDSVGVFRLSGKNAKATHWTYVRQLMRWQPDETEKWTFPYGTLPVTVEKAEGEGDTYPVEEGWHIRRGAVRFALWAQPRGIRTDRVEIPLHEAPFRPFAIRIYNVAAQQWEPVAKDRPLVIDGGNRERYLDPQGKVRLEIANPSEEALLSPYPYFYAEGEGMPR
ncbi:hypothetical protein BSNK01_07700 [Bacillaceae bacterium]